MSKKLTFSKLNAKLNTEVTIVNFNDQSIEVKQYLPIEEKLQLIDEVINIALNVDYDFFNPGLVDLEATIGIVTYYTNISFTEAQKKDRAKLYDILMSSGLAQKIADAIPYNELNALDVILEKALENIYKHRNSLTGILEKVAGNYDKVNFDTAATAEKLNNPEVLGLLKQLVSNLG